MDRRAAVDKSCCLILSATYMRLPFVSSRSVLYQIRRFRRWTWYNVPNRNMGSISIRKRKNGSSSYLARVRVMREGTSYHETKTFDRRPAATAWIEKREKELAKPGALEGLNVSDPLRSKAIERHTEEAEKEIGRTKAQVLRTIATCRLSQGHAKQHLHRRARLDGGVAAGPLPATSACRCGIPGHGGLEPTSRDIAAQCTAGQRIVSEPRRLSA